MDHLQKPDRLTGVLGQLEHSFQMTEIFPVKTVTPANLMLHKHDAVATYNIK